MDRDERLNAICIVNLRRHVKNKALHALHNERYYICIKMHDSAIVKSKFASYNGQLN